MPVEGQPAQAPVQLLGPSRFLFEVQTGPGHKKIQIRGASRPHRKPAAVATGISRTSASQARGVAGQRRPRCDGGFSGAAILKVFRDPGLRSRQRLRHDAEAAGEANAGKRNETARQGDAISTRAPPRNSNRRMTAMLGTAA